MEKIASFTIDHNKLLRGIFVSRQDKLGGETVTTFDIRMKEPNREPVLDVPALHTLEHVGATFLRNHSEWGAKTVYFGPMGCRTGCYVLFHGDLTSEMVAPIVKEMFEFVAGYEQEIPGSSDAECGNYLSHDLSMARLEAQKFIAEVLDDLQEENLNYQQ